MVDGENQESWTWFLEILCGALNISDGLDWSLISDVPNSKLKLGRREVGDNRTCASFSG